MHTHSTSRNFHPRKAETVQSTPFLLRLISLLFQYFFALFFDREHNY